MKKFFCILTVAFAALAVSCNKLEPKEEIPVDPSGEQITITVSLAEALTKISLTQDPDDADGAIKVSWVEGDKIYVIDASNANNSQEFTVATIDRDQPWIATFTGQAVSADSFNILYGAESVSAAEAIDFSFQTQSGNAPTAGLQYLALMEGVNSCDNIEFSKAWAEANGNGTFKQNGALRLRLQVPDEVTSVASVALIAPTAIFGGSDSITVKFDGDTTPDGGIITAYAMLPMGDAIDVAADATLEVVIEAANGNIYRKLIPAGAKSFKPGQANAIKLNKSNWVLDPSSLFAGGRGVEEDPYLIANAEQMNNMHKVMEAGSTIYFRLIDDIDMTGFSWDPLNHDPFNKAINLDGDNHKISHLDAALFDDLNGTVVNLTIEEAVVSGTSTTGILANKIQTAASTVTNVDINNSSIESTSYVGGLIGEIDVDNTSVTDCDVIDTNVKGTLAGGVIGFANALVTMSGCNYSGGTVTATSRYCGGMLASTANKNSVITDCHVENATITNTATGDVRTGGFVGQLHTKVTVKGCSVGTSSQRVTVNLAAPAASDSKLNAGGFAGTSYGTITKNGDVRTTAYVTVTCANPNDTDHASYQLDLGGFTGYHQGTIEYTDADVVMSGICGKYVGGFCGLQNGGTIRYCTVTGSVTGNEGTGGFVGYANKAGSTITECSSTAVVSRPVSAGVEFGSFGGLIDCATITKCYATSDISVNGNYVGGFIGGVSPSAGKSATIQKCWSTGNMGSSSAQCGGFIGHIAANATGAVFVYDCYSTGNITKGNQRKGGFIGQINSGIVEIARCYATGTLTAGSFAQGGLIGYMNAGATIEDCAAWNSTITAASFGAGNWSSGAVIGVAYPSSTKIANNFRNPNMALKAFWGNVTGYTFELLADYDHADVDGSDASTYLIVKDKSTGVEAASTTATLSGGNYPIFPYHGKHSTTSRLSTLASTAKASGGLGWSSEVWDFTGDLPTLK